MAEKPPKPPGNYMKLNKTREDNENRTVLGKSGITEAVRTVSNLYKNYISTGHKSTTPTSDGTINNENKDLSKITTNTTTPITNCEKEDNTLRKKSNCDCTNISIMHLFHEMKQEFPTIPDHLVAQYVNENCHERELCLQFLRNELALHPIPVQAYPAKVLQQLQQQQQSSINAKKLLKPIRKAPNPNSANNAGISYSTLLKNHETNETEDARRPRPTTLNLKSSQQPQFQQLQVQLKQHIQQRNQQQENSNATLNPTPTSTSINSCVGKPMRKAPLPPIPPKPIHLSCSGSPVHIQHNSSFKLESSSKSNEPEISLNVSVSSPQSPLPSPKAFIPKPIAQQSPVRHRAVLNVNPHPPYTSAYNNHNSPTGTTPKSFTTVNLTLRQPGQSVSAPQSTIDISAGPGVSSDGGSGLMYSSTSYNAMQGTQKNFYITVTDEGSEIGARRIRSEDLSLPNIQQNVNPMDYFVNNNEEIDAILERQKIKRDKLIAVLRDNKKRLNQIDEEIHILTEPGGEEETMRLDSEIQQLRCDCETMLNEIEVARRRGKKFLK